MESRYEALMDVVRGRMTNRAFAPVFSANTNGSILLAANTLETCVDSASCTTARNATTGNFSNNNYTSRYVDVDGDAATFNSSSATLTVPDGGAVLYALLVWGGRTTASAPPGIEIGGLAPHRHVDLLQHVLRLAVLAQDTQADAKKLR